MGFDQDRDSADSNGKLYFSPIGGEANVALFTVFGVPKSRWNALVNRNISLRGLLLVLIEFVAGNFVFIEVLVILGVVPLDQNPDHYELVQIYFQYKTFQ